MADPKTTYVVSIFDTVAKVWRNLLTTTDKAKAEGLLKRIARRSSKAQVT